MDHQNKFENQPWQAVEKMGALDHARKSTLLEGDFPCHQRDSKFSQRTMYESFLEYKGVTKDSEDFHGSSVGIYSETPRIRFNSFIGESEGQTDYD